MLKPTLLPINRSDSTYTAVLSGPQRMDQEHAFIDKTQRLFTLQMAHQVCAESARKG